MRRIPGTEIVAPNGTYVSGRPNFEHFFHGYPCNL